MTSIHKTEMNIQIPLWSFRDLNGILKIFLKVATENAQQLYNNSSNA